MASIKQVTLGNTAYTLKATYDGDGNTIASYYVKKSGDTMSGALTISGLLTVVNSGITTTFGSQNTGFVHIYNDSQKPFIFNNTVATTSGDLGTTAYPFNNAYLKGLINIDHTGTTRASNTMYNLMWVTFKNSANSVSYSGYPISYLGTDGTDGYNTAFRFGSMNGPTFITAGESGGTLPQALGTYNTEGLFLSADGVVQIYSGCSNDGTSYKLAQSIDTTGRTTFLNYNGAGFYGRNISYGTAAPSGGSYGDVYIQYS